MARKKKYNKQNKNNNANNVEKEIFVYTQITGKENEGAEMQLHPVTLELLNSARELSCRIQGKVKVCAVVCKNENEVVENLKAALYKGGADKIYHIKNEKIKSSIGVARGISELCKAKNPEIFLIGATIEGRTIAPLIASSLNTGLTADCTKLEITNYKDEKKLASSRPTFGGQLMATILCKTTPQMATVRPGVLKPCMEEYKQEGEFEEFCPNLEDFNDPITILGTEINKNKFSNELENAQIVVAGGKGLKTEENFDKLKKFAKLIGAAVAASRGAVDMGLIEKEHQVGQTGKTIAPKVYMAFGISGAIHHIAGINNAEKIIAINSDKNAPIFENSDVGIVADAANVLDELIKELEETAS